MELEDKTTQRFENFILMVIEEVSNEMNDQARTFKSQELREELKREQTKALIKAIVIKTMMNLQKKRAFNTDFISKAFGLTIKDD